MGLCDVRLRAFFLSGDQSNTLLEELESYDLWFAFAVFPHVTQGLQEVTEFVLIFNDGHCSENEMLLFTELFAHMPRDVLAKKFVCQKLPSTIFLPKKNTSFVNLC